MSAADRVLDETARVVRGAIDRHPGTWVVMLVYDAEARNITAAGIGCDSDVAWRALGHAVDSRREADA